MYFHGPFHWLEGLMISSLLKQFLAYLCFFTGNEQIFYLTFILCFLTPSKKVKWILYHHFVLCYCIVCKASYSTFDTIVWTLAMARLKKFQLALYPNSFSWVLIIWNTLLLVNWLVGESVP